MKDAFICLEHVSFSYGADPVLEDVSLSVYPRDYLAIIGPNGGGKTTLLRIVLGLLKPQSGTVRVMGDDPAGARIRLGYVPQSRPWNPAFPISVWDVTLMGRLPYARPGARYSRTDADRAAEALEKVGMLGLKDRAVDQLSEGQKQRVFIARALALEPAVLLLDEPTSSVDVCIQKDVYDMLNRLKNDMAVVLVTHDIGSVSHHVERIACLNRRLFCHEGNEITGEILNQVYSCPVDIIAHGIPHRVLREHTHD